MKIFIDTGAWVALENKNKNEGRSYETALFQSIEEFTIQAPVK